MRVLLLLAGVSALKQSPKSIKELVGWVYPNDAPKFVTVPSPAQLAVAGNSSALLQLANLDISPYPLQPGYVDFTYLHHIVNDIPEGSTMAVHSYVDGEEWYTGEANICDYLPFAKLGCPVAAYKEPLVNTTKLQVPNNGYDNRFSFVAKVEAPNGDAIVHVAAIIDCVPPEKDEL